MVGDNAIEMSSTAMDFPPCSSQDRNAGPTPNCNKVAYEAQYTDTCEKHYFQCIKNDAMGGLPTTLCFRCTYNPYKSPRSFGNQKGRTCMEPRVGQDEWCRDMTG